MKTYRQWLDIQPRMGDAERCPVCGHKTVKPMRRSLNWMMLILLGAALCYIVVDVVHDGHLDERIFDLLSRHHATVDHGGPAA